MALLADRIPPVPSSLTGAVRDWADALTQAVNRLPPISGFSGLDPGTAGLKGQPGWLAVNFASASTDSRLWVHGGAANSYTTTEWKVVRIA